jgi:hypothetical protein
VDNYDVSKNSEVLCSGKSIKNGCGSDAARRPHFMNVVRCVLPPNYVRVSHMKWWWDSVYNASVCRIIFVIRGKVGCEG